MTPKNNFKKDSVLPVTQECELMDFLITNLPHKNRNNIKSILKNRQVLVDGVVQTPFNFLLNPGEEVSIKWNKSADKDISTGIRLMHEDSNFYVVHKDAGILTYPIKQGLQASVYSKLLHYAKRKNPKVRLYLVKSLDKDSSGLVMFAKSDKQQGPLIEAINATGEFVYSAVLEGSMINGGTGESKIRIYESKAFKMHFTDDPKSELSTCEYEVVNANKQLSAVRFVTKGNEAKHQVRMHALDIGYPVVGDKKYGSNSSPIKRLALHRNKITFTNPFTKMVEHFECAKPRKFSRLI